ncbi:MAG TPA: MerR family transcriptional regulator [Thermoanaerobaculia bacterium]|nr:MerR family transcriptional regulator [Thermoanaerobaculia bacterium]
MSADGEKRYKIGEVCRLADVQPYVLRYWETEFPALAPGKSGGGQRLYSQREIDIILMIKKLLYTEGFTIAGAKKKLEQELEQGEPPLDSEPQPVRTEISSDARQVIAKMRRELRELLAILDK